MDDHRTAAALLRRALGLALAALFVAGGALSAQGHGEKGGHGMMMERHDAGMSAGGMHGGHGALLGHVPTAILHQAELLGLADDQEERLEALKDSLASMREARHEDRGSMREGMESAFTEGGIDVEAYESALRSMADRRISARVEVARIAERALQVLDDGQREKFLYGIHLMHRMHRMHQGGHGMMDRGMKEHRGMERGEKKMEKEGGGR